MNKKEKIKKHKPLPSYIEHSAILSYVVAVFIGIGLIQLLIALNIGHTRNLTTVFFIVLAPLMGFTVGWYLKFRYVQKNGDDAQLLRIKAQYWGAMAFLISFIVSLLLIMLILIQLENSMLPKSLPDPIIFALSMSIIGVSLYIANNAKKRIYRNFQTT